MVLVQTTNRYQLERDIESVTSNSANWLKERFKEVLESDKDASRKCDYLGYSILNLDAKLHLLEDEIKELRHLKEHLTSAKSLALEVGAELFSEYGINKLEGAGISSITVYQPLHAPKLTITVNNEQALIKAGFVKEVVDVASIKEAYESGQYKKLIEEHCTVTFEAKEESKRLKINKRRSVNNHDAVSPSYLSSQEEKAS